MNNLELRSLRQRLKQDTAGAHARVDTMLSTLDLACADEFGSFLQVHLAAFLALDADLGQTPVRDMLRDLCDRLTDDLVVLQLKPLDVRSPSSPLDPMAVEYILLGSRLGSKVLRKQWSASTDERVRAARHYFSAPDAVDAWRAFCDRAELVASGADSAEKIVNDTRVIFALFERMFHAVQASEHRTHHAI